MSNLATAAARAQNVKTPKRAAELYNDVDYELALTDDEDAYEHGETALGILEERFPGVKSAARNVTEPPKLSRGAGAALRVVDPDEKPEPGEHTEKPRPGVRERVSSATAIHGRRRGRRRSTGSRLLAQTGLPAGADSASRLIMRGLGTIAGLSLLYLLLSQRGSSALGYAGGFVDKSLAAFVDPTRDPLQDLAGPNINPATARVTRAGAARSQAIAAAPAPLAPGSKASPAFIRLERAAAAATGHPGVIPPASVYRSATPGHPGNADTVGGGVSGPLFNWLRGHGYNPQQIRVFESDV